MKLLLKQEAFFETRKRLLEEFCLFFQDERGYSPPLPFDWVGGGPQKQINVSLILVNKK